MSEKLVDMASNLENSLRRRGLTENNYGIVGFGGVGAHNEPNTHTMNGRIMGTIDNIAQGFSSLQFLGQSHGDAMLAIKKAANYPFRTGVSKTIILFSCNKCEEREVGYAELTQLLEDKDIRMHIMLEHQFELFSESKAPQSSFIYGNYL